MKFTIYQYCYCSGESEEEKSFYKVAEVATLDECFTFFTNIPCNVEDAHLFSVKNFHILAMNFTIIYGSFRDNPSNEFPLGKEELDFYCIKHFYYIKQKEGDNVSFEDFWVARYEFLDRLSEENQRRIFFSYIQKKNYYEYLDARNEFLRENGKDASGPNNVFLKNFILGRFGFSKRPRNRTLEALLDSGEQHISSQKFPKLLEKPERLKSVKPIEKKVSELSKHLVPETDCTSVKDLPSQQRKVQKLQEEIREMDSLSQRLKIAQNSLYTAVFACGIASLLMIAVIGATMSIALLPYIAIPVGIALIGFIASEVVRQKKNDALQNKESLENCVTAEIKPIVQENLQVGYAFFKQTGNGTEPIKSVEVFLSIKHA